MAVSRAAVLSLDPATYRRHALHADDRAWIEKNCYVDIWIEVVHALGLEPLAMLPFTLAVDFETDQWTFFKPPAADLWDLYGIDVQELNVWRPILDQSLTHLAAGKLVSTEADAFFLPDTRGTDYRTQHTKTTIVIQDVDVEQRRLGYFHNAGYYTLEGDDFSHLFRLGAAPDPTFMPLFAELIRIDRLKRLPTPALAAHSRRLLTRHLRRLPARNPIAAFCQQFTQDIPHLQEQGLATYHAYAFATVRQLGAAFEVAAQYLEWLRSEGDEDLDPAIAAFGAISTSAKTLILKAARTVMGKRTVDFGPHFDEMALAWERGMNVLLARYAGGAEI